MDGLFLATRYPDARAFTIEDGRRYEEFVAAKTKFLFDFELHFFEGKTAQLQGENREGVEIKFDAQMKETGNIFLEVAEKSRAANAAYYPSGVFRKDNSTRYWIGDYKQAFVFVKSELQERLRKTVYKKITKPTAIGFLMPVEEAKALCKTHLVFCVEAEAGLSVQEQKSGQGALW